MSTPSREPSDRLIKVTNFFASGSRNCEEKLAEPEDSCEACKDCDCSESGCGDEGTAKLDADQDSLSTQNNESA